MSAVSDQMRATAPHGASEPYVHASAIVIGEAGVLIRGASGAGKSALALAVLALAKPQGLFARLVGDDRISLAGAHGRLIARGHPAVAGQIEQRGQGILTMAYEPAAVLRLVVDLLPAADVPRTPLPDETEVDLYGAKLSRLALPDDRSAYDGALIVLACLRRAETI